MSTKEDQKLFSFSIDSMLQNENQSMGKLSIRMSKKSLSPIRESPRQSPVL